MMTTVSPTEILSQVGKAQSSCTHGDLVSNFGWTVQGILATLAFACLIIKRFCEPPNQRRSWLIWFFDTSKQACGALVIHFINILLAELFEGADPCTQYIISFLLDSSLGLLIIYCGIRITQIVAIKRGCEYLVFGDYGKPRPKKKFWFYQCLAYVLIMSFSKLIVAMLLQLKFWDKVRDLLLWLFGLILIPNLEVTLVVLVIPFFVNVFMFWVTDNFLTMHRNETKVNKAMAAMRDKFKLPCKLPAMTCCFRRGIDGDDATLVEVTFDNSQAIQTTSA